MTVFDGERFACELVEMVAAVLAGGRDIPTLRRAVDASAAAAEARCGDTPVACGPGCPSCCVLNVAVLLPEALIIADWLQRELAPAALTALRGRLARHSCEGRWMEDAQRIFARAACPFVDEEGNCAIHPVRPLVCRGAASFNKESCRTAFAPLTADEERRVAVDVPRQRAYDGAFMALAEALRGYGLDDRSIELGTGVQAFLDDPEQAARLIGGARLPHALWE